jgi:hypothetical protein
LRAACFARLHVGLHVIGFSRSTPSPAARRRPSAVPCRVEGRRKTTVKASDTAPYTAFIWKTIADPFAGRTDAASCPVR